MFNVIRLHEQLTDSKNNAGSVHTGYEIIRNSKNNRTLSSNISEVVGKKDIFVYEIKYYMFYQIITIIIWLLFVKKVTK